LIRFFFFCWFSLYLFGLLVNFFFIFIIFLLFVFFICLIFFISIEVKMIFRFAV